MMTPDLAGSVLALECCPVPEQVQLQAQLLDLRGRRPIARTGHGTRGQAVDESHHRTQDLIAQRRWPTGPFAPVFREAARKKPLILAVYPDVEASELLVCGDLPPKRHPESAFGESLLVKRQRFGQHLQQICLAALPLAH